MRTYQQTIPDEETPRAPRGVQGKKRRFEPTEEQRQKAQERRERLKGIWTAIKGLSDDERAAQAARLGIRTIEGRTLSDKNQLLLAGQRAGVSVVGGFKQWRTAGRYVVKGCSALAIWVPTGDLEGDSGEINFVTGNVFDIADTAPIEDAANSEGVSS